MEQKHINQLEREQEYSTGEREFPKQLVDDAEPTTMEELMDDDSADYPWADTLEEANE